MINTHFKQSLKNSKGIIDANALALNYALFKTYDFLNKSYFLTKSATLKLADKAESLIKGKKEKLFSFKTYKDTPKDRSDPNKDTYIIVHGYLSEPDAFWVKDLASSLKTQNSQVITLNWKDVVKHLNIKEDSKNIEQVAQTLSQELKDWKLNPSKTTIIGHSLGALQSAILAKKINEKTGQKVKLLVALDPAGLFNYSYNYKGDKFYSFANLANKTLCISSYKSTLSNETLLSSCDLAFFVTKEKSILSSLNTYLFSLPYERLDGLVSFVKNSLKKHSLPYILYYQMINDNTLYNLSLSPQNPSLPQHDKIYSNDEEGRKIQIDGYLITDNKDNLKYFLGKRSNSDLYISSSSGTTYTCDKPLFGKATPCIYYDWTSDNNYNLSSKSMIKNINNFKYNQVNGKIKNSSDKLIVTEPDYISAKGDRLIVFYNKQGKILSVYLTNIGENKLKEWVEIAKTPISGKYIKTDKQGNARVYTGRDLLKLKEKNPIQIIY